MLRRTGYFAERTAAGALGAGEAVTDFLGTGLYTGLEKIASLGGKAPNPLSEWAGKAADSFTDNSITERYRENIDQLYHPSESEQRWGNLNEGGGQLAASILSGNGLGKALGTGAKLLSGADKAARTAGYSQAVFGLSAAGGGLNEAVQEGASREDALKYGAASGAKEVIIENIFGGIPGLGDGKASQLVKRVVSHPAVSRILDIAGEGGEETLSTFVTPYIKRAIYDKNAKNATLEEMAESAVQGILLSGASNLGMGLASAGNRVAEVFPRPGAGAQRTAQVEKQADAVSGIFDEAESSVLLRRAGGVTTQAQSFVGEADGVLDPAARGMRRDSAEASTVQSDPESSRVLRQIAETHLTGTEKWSRKEEESEPQKTAVEKLETKGYTERNKTEQTEEPIYKTFREGGIVEDVNLAEMDNRMNVGTNKYGLSAEEALVVSRYVSGSAYEWTAVQRGDPDYEHTEYVQMLIDTNTSALKKFPSFDGRTYRNLRFTDSGKYQEFMREHETGHEVVLKAFTSSSKDPNGYIVSGNHVVHLVIDGLSGKDISNTFSTPEQKEVVYLPGTVLHVNSVATANDGNPIIYAREVIADGKNLGTDYGRDEQGFSAANNAGRKGNAGRVGYDQGSVHGNGGISARIPEVAGREMDSADARTLEEVNDARYDGRGQVSSRTHSNLHDSKRDLNNTVWEASVDQAYQAGLSGLPESGVPTGATPAQRSAYEAGRAESIRRLEQELDSVSQAQAHYFGSESGLVRDKFWKRAYLSSRDSRRMDALGKVLGVQIRFAETVADRRANAKYENGVITLALDAKDPVMTSVLHESVHRIREISPESYDALSGFVQNHMSTDKLDSALKDRSQLYQTTDNVVLTEEVVADAFGVMLKDSAVLDQLVKDNRAAAEKALDVVRDIINSIRRTLHQRNLDLTKNQKSAFRDLESRLTEMEENFTDALKTAGEQKDTIVEGEEGNVKFSKKDIEDPTESEDIEKYSEIRYHEDGTIVVTDDWTTQINPNITKKYRPNAVVDTLSRKGKQRDRTIYGPDAIIKQQIHGGNHSQPKNHMYGKHGEHIHDYTWYPDRDNPDKPARELTDFERAIHDDIIRYLKGG